MRKAELRLDVSAALGGDGPLSTAATVYWGDDLDALEVVAEQIAPQIG